MDIFKVKRIVTSLTLCDNRDSHRSSIKVFSTSLYQHGQQFKFVLWGSTSEQISSLHIHHSFLGGSHLIKTFHRFCNANHQAIMSSSCLTSDDALHFVFRGEK